ncbi:hypothetical protein [Mycolicibacterium tusciae]|uniref:hypothetical protein n=1 Tax=Mycolicibacterium tusciae TaxID=75922 RepID=UPI00024A3716|nr:hypothetical protein [Mycolicibacterium tusciae]
MTFTRTGDADPGVQVTDPAILPPRVPAPAQGFRGRYHYVRQYTDGTKNELDYRVVTACLRSGDRCLSYLHQPDGVTAIAFADNQWVSAFTTDTAKCKNGEPRHNEFHTVFPVPQPAPDPLPTVTGTGQAKTSGGCTGTWEYTTTFTRTGD